MKKINDIYYHAINNSTDKEIRDAVEGRLPGIADVLTSHEINRLRFIISQFITDGMESNYDDTGKRLFHGLLLLLQYVCDYMDGRESDAPDPSAAMPDVRADAIVDVFYETELIYLRSAVSSYRTSGLYRPTKTDERIEQLFDKALEILNPPPKINMEESDDTDIYGALEALGTLFSPESSARHTCDSKVVQMEKEYYPESEFEQDLFRRDKPEVVKKDLTEAREMLELMKEKIKRGEITAEERGAAIADVFTLDELECLSMAVMYYKRKTRGFEETADEQPILENMDQIFTASILKKCQEE